MMNRFALFSRVLLVAAIALVPVARAAGPMPSAKAPIGNKACVFDLMGSQGENYALARDFALEAQREGVPLHLVPYMNESVAFEDFKAGQCDAVMITNLRARQFNRFVGSVDAIGAVPNEQTLRAVLNLLHSPKSAERMVQGPYEVAGIVPLGAVYPFVDDRSINTLAKAAGKKIAVFDWDRTQRKLVQNIGAQPVSSDILNWATKFNNGQVDIDVPAAQWLTAQGVTAIGADNMALEVLPNPDHSKALPVHQHCLAEAGVHIIENLVLDELAADGVTQFCIIVLPPKMRGATGAPVRPVAIV